MDRRLVPVGAGRAMTPFGGGGNRRSARRAAPVQALAVDDLINGGVLGTVVNLSEGGVMLLTDQPLRPGAVFQVALRPLEEVLSAPPLSLGLDCLRSEEHTSELQSRGHLVCRLLLEKIKNI